jgi:O-antigen/teichoic acid export membrane protein
VRNSLSFAVVCRIITNLCAVATAFIGLRLYNLYLTKEVYGTVLVAAQFLTYLPLVGGGFGMVLGQQMLAAQDRPTIAKLARFSQVLQSHILVVAFLAGLALMAIYSQMPAARTTGLPLPLFFAIGVAGVATFYSGGQIGMMVGLGRQVHTIILTGIWSVLGLLILWGGFLLDCGVWAMPISTGLSALLLLPVAWVLQRRIVEGLPILSWHREADFWPKLRNIWVPSLAWLQSQVSIMFLFTLDIILMGMLFGPGAAAVYGIVSRVTGMSKQVIQALCDTAWPRLAQEPDLQRKADLMRKVDRLNAWIAGSWYGAMAATLQPFLGWLMKTDWVAGPLLISLVLARNLIVSLSAPHAYGLLSAGRFKELARATQREVVLVVLGIFLFGHFFGMIGVALATLAATGGGSLWYMTYLYFRQASSKPWFSEWCAVYARGLSSAALAFATASLVWWGEKVLLGAPGCMAMIAGGLGFGLGMSAAILFGLTQSGGNTRSLGRWIRLPTKW